MQAPIILFIHKKILIRTNVIAFIRSLGDTLSVYSLHRQKTIFVNQICYRLKRWLR